MKRLFGNEAEQMPRVLMSLVLRMLRTELFMSLNEEVG